MTRYHLTRKAVDDLNSIWRYTFKNWSERQADDYYQNLIISCERIAENPLVGRVYNQITPGLLGVKVNRHIVFYRMIDNEDIEIIRFLHVTMDLRKQLLNE